MSYQKTTWVNGETPINADNLNKIEAGIENVENEINNLNLSEMFTIQSFSKSAGSIASQGAVTVDIDISKTGYKPLSISKLSLSGTSITACTLYRFGINRDNTNVANIAIKNTGSNSATPTVSIDVLFIKI